jgi:lauroyl/myristoyl acyltransferase
MSFKVEKIKSINLFQVFIKIYSIFFSLLPLNIVKSIFCNKFTLYLFACSKEGRKAERNIYKIYKNDDNLFLRRHVEFLLSMVYDLCCFYRNKKNIDFSGIGKLKENMELAESFNKGQLFVTAHLGNWEFLGYCAQNITKKDFWALGKPLKSVFFTRLIKHLRSFLGVLVLWTGKNNFQKKLINIVKKKEWVAFLIDQKPNLRRGPIVDFMGYKTEFIAGPAKLALKYNTPIVLAFCLQQGKCRYNVISQVILDPKSVFKDVESLTQYFAMVIESNIRKNPEQWCWIYKRWK